MTETARVDFIAPETNECPYSAYDQLREPAPAYYNSRTDIYIVTR